MRHIIFTLAILLASFIASAQLLWEITGPDNVKPSYLIGTHHLAPTSILDSIKGWEQAFNNCDMVIGEVDQAQLNAPGTQYKMSTAALAPADSTFEKIYTSEQIDSLDLFLSHLSVGTLSMSTFKIFKPTFVNTQISLLISIRNFPDFNPNNQLDTYVQKSALEAGKETIAFETLEQQIDILFNYPIEQQAQELLSTMRNEVHLVDFSKQLASAYLAQNLDSVHKLSLHPTLGTDPESQARLIDNRNKAWVNTLLNILPQKSVIVCVGALHLPGDNGLIKLLRNQGYIVTPITK